MFIPPLVMSRLEKTATFVKNPWMKAPVTVLLTGLMLTGATPLGCAIFPQKAEILVTDLEPNLQKLAADKFSGKRFYYNKGL